jgi:tetratricopeptide (TPR) repeat protein
MVLYLNMSSCHKALQNNESAEKCLEKAMHIQTELGNEVPSYLLYLLINQGLYAKLDGRLKESEQYFKESLKYKLTNNQLYLVGKNLSEVSRNLDKDTLKYVSLEAEPLYKRFYQNNICLSTLRFWE